MIQIFLSDKAYENDVYPIVKAFYPEEDIRVLGISSQFEEDMSSCVNNNTELGKITICLIRIIFHSDRANIEIIDNMGKIYEASTDTPSPVNEKSAYKNTIKRRLYNMLSALSEKELPWGILTGIRPTKLLCEMLENGLDEQEIYSRMEKEYLCSKDKIKTSIIIAKREIELLNEMDYRNGYSLYIGIPFCPSICLYCSFASFSVEKHANIVEDYLKALEEEIRYGSTCFPDKKLSTVYLGGGTPTTLSANQLDRILGLIRELYDFTHVKEFCVEAGRPDSITEEKLRVIKKWGVNRISINPQTMQQRTLDLIGRIHTTSQIYKAFQMARDIGYDNINMDIIIGLPGETPEDVTDTLNKVKALNPDSLTVHTLALKRASRLNTDKAIYRGKKAKDVSRMLEVSKEFAGNNDYLPYYLYRQKNMEENLENIGYARFGKEGLYNILIMEERQTILALGAGAVSKFVFHDTRKIDRVDNVKSPIDYISRIDEMIMRKKEFILMNPQCYC